MKIEIKDIKGYPKYQITNCGRVLSHKFKVVRVLKPAITKNGYKTVSLRKAGKYKIFLIHRLVAITFIKNPDLKRCVNHKDGNKLNNKVENLEWCTYSENMIHAYKHGLTKVCIRKGETNGSAKLNRFQVQRIRLMKEVSPKLPYKRIGEMFGVSLQTVHTIVKRINWKHI